MSVIYEYSDVAETMKGWIVTNTQNDIPVGCSFPYKKHIAVAKIKEAGFVEFYEGSKMSGFISQAITEHKAENPELYPNTEEHKSAYPEYYQE